MKEYKDIQKMLLEKGTDLTVPKSLCPEQMYQTLKEHTSRQQIRKKRRYFLWTNVACLCLVAGLVAVSLQSERSLPWHSSVDTARQKAPTNHLPAEPEEPLPEELAYAKMDYEEIYTHLSEQWQDTYSFYDTEDKEDTFARAEASKTAEDIAATKGSFGQTNIQVEGVQEADQIKNDGRYLYQIVSRQQKEEDGGVSTKTGIQILDTKDGLKETAFLQDFESLEEFHLWNDLLIAIENKYYDAFTPLESAKRIMETDDIAYQAQGYHQISIYQISDRQNPQKLKTFTLKGSYESSRIAGGYLYAISHFAATPGEGAEDVGAYVPSLDGKPIEADRIVCPADTDASDYLVFISIDLSHPTSFADSKAVLSGNGTYYVSPQNIYVAWYQSFYDQKPSGSQMLKDQTRFLRILCQEGKFYVQAEGSAPGQVENSFSMDEYEGNLRMVTTVHEYQATEVIDDRTGESIGIDYGEAKETNALYILDSSLSILGKVEGLAKGEHIYSARFLGEAGYFVTFRQTDPLFAVDLSDPEHPKVLGELKVSGFSEYLHFYGEDRLLGIGMEADPETGREQGMKLSMFDLSNPGDLQEIAKLPLADYHYSEILWNHRAILIDTEKNLFGFQAQGSSDNQYLEHYLLFSYQNESFVQTLKINTHPKEDEYHQVRGTFIGNTLYLLYNNGTAQAYDMVSGALLEEYST